MNAERSKTRHTAERCDESGTPEGSIRTPPKGGTTYQERANPPLTSLAGERIIPEVRRTGGLYPDAPGAASAQETTNYVLAGCLVSFRVELFYAPFRLIDRKRKGCQKREKTTSCW